MKTAEIITKTTVYTSEIMREVSGTSDLDAEVIAWADANPVVWRIVCNNKSHTFGRTSTDYMGCERADTPSCALSRATTFKRVIDGDRSAGRGAGDFWTWRARFTMEHYKDKGFKGGFFQQFDGSYDRGCISLDYTPETLDEVVKRFRAWCDSSACPYDTVSIKLDKKVIFTVKGG